MTKDTIVQFVCFITNLEPDEFAPKWEQYARMLMNKKGIPALQQQVTGTKSKFRYISRHEWSDRDIKFSFMSERNSAHFPEQNVRVVEIGGYVTQQGKKGINEEEGDCKLIAFISHNENDINYYSQLPLFRELCIHQAFYESCQYGYVLEFIVPETDADELLALLKQRPGVETGIYKECLVQLAG